MKAFVVAKAIILNQNGEMLVLKRSQSDVRRPGEWDFPGGLVDDGEDVAAAAIRETLEEAGLTITDPQLVFGMSDMTEHGSGTWLVFMATPTDVQDIKIVLSHEHDAFQWMKPQEFLAICSYDRQKKMVRYIVDNFAL